MPVTIFGVLALIASIVTLWLPETIYANMHQTIEEAESAKEDFRVPCLNRNKRHERIDDTNDMPAELYPLKNAEDIQHMTSL